MISQEPKPVDANFPRLGDSRGAIVNMGSFCSTGAAANLVTYTAAKHAALAITKTAAIENAAHGIRVNCVCPAWVDTQMLKDAKKAIPILNDETAVMNIPMNRIGIAEEIANVVLFLCSSRSSFVTGVSLPVDGGMALM